MTNRLHTLLSGGFLLLFMANAYADSPFVGRFAGKMEYENSSLALELDCTSESECRLLSKAISNGSAPHEDTRQLSEIAPLENIDEAVAALGYARDHKSEKISNREDAALFATLQPLLNSDIGIDRCLDLGFGGPGYSLICSTHKSAWAKPSLLFMGTLMASCRNSFCRYVIYPMFKK